MIRTLTLACLLAGLTACGDEQAAQTPAAPATEVAASSAAMSPADPAAPPASETPAAPAAADDDAVSYDPIDVTKLDNAWWRQYSAGG